MVFTPFLLQLLPKQPMNQAGGIKTLVVEGLTVCPAILLSALSPALGFTQGPLQVSRWRFGAGFLFGLLFPPS
jgi:hypothetical protein